MELFKEVLTEILRKEKIVITFPDLKVNAGEIAEMQCYQTLQKIRAVIENDSLSDFDCVEEIVCIFEAFGSNCGNRHDFG